MFRLLEVLSFGVGALAACGAAACHVVGQPVSLAGVVMVCGAMVLVVAFADAIGGGE